MTCPWRGKRHGGAARAGLTAAALLVALPHGHALAADWVDHALRGSFTSPAPVRWDGINFGVGVGVSNLNTDFGNGTSSLVAYMLRTTTIENENRVSDWATMPATTTSSKQYSAFLGYNVQMQDIVLGVDLGYVRPQKLDTAAADNITRTFTTSDDFSNTVTVSASSSLKLIDYAALRGRIGYAMGQFLPYVMFGGAVGRFDYTTQATVTAQGTDISNPPLGRPPYGPVTLSMAESKNGAITGGFLFGLGADVALTPNVFLRGEWEFVAFAPVHGIRSNLNTARVSLGMRF
ncbi:MAG: outer membrane beta-barrel protein [Pseudolabrys sp.]|nr:outer membrane beta-barrel protein [Pseudolabrys sp.]